MTLRKVNLVILVLLAVAFLIIVQRNLFNLSDFLRKENPDAIVVLPFESKLSQDSGLDSGLDQALDSGLDSGARSGVQIPVLITAAEERLGAAVTAINSIFSNTKANVVFTIVALNQTVRQLRTWMSEPKLKRIRYKIVVFDPELLKGKSLHDPARAQASKPLSFVRFYLPLFVPDAEKVIYVDDDIIVQGDIQELFQVHIKPGQTAAFSDDCDSTAKGIVRGSSHQNTYLGFLDFRKQSIKALGLRANTCSFSPGVIVANMSEWKNHNITEKLEQWLELDTRENLFSKTSGDSVTPPLLLVFYRRHANITPIWHIRHLGSLGAGNRFSSGFLRAAKLLHWDGHYKPWGHGAAFTDLWDQWYIPDPTGSFHRIRRHDDRL